MTDGDRGLATATTIDRACIAVLVPETNVTLAADLVRLAVPGVTVRYGRLAMGNGQMADDDEQQDMLGAARASIERAVAEMLPYAPRALMMGLSIETFQGGRSGTAAFTAHLRRMVGGRPVAAGAEACARALTALGARRIGIVTPYQPAADAVVRRFFEESGFEVAALEGLKVPHASQIAAVAPERIRTSIEQVARLGVDAIIQCGTNLSILDLTEDLESNLGVPVLSMNATTFWHALRLCNIHDRLHGFGALLREY